jgi:hypothetical protein
MAIFQIKQPSSRQSTVQNIATGATSATLANPFGPSTTQVRLSATQAVYYVVVDTTNIVAASASNGSYLPAGVIEHITVQPGQKITAIQASAAGSLNVVEEN